MKKLFAVKPLVIVLSVIMLSLCSGCSGRTQEKGILEYGEPQDVGIAAGQLEEAVNLFKTAVEENRVTGVQLLVARHGKVVVHEGLGYRDLEDPISKYIHGFDKGLSARI